MISRPFLTKAFWRMTTLFTVIVMLSLIFLLALGLYGEKEFQKVDADAYLID